ncbi:secretin and TonB N-terminal domain-containing protein [Massilia endophytica]|uniref:secretin and TonB N-terminal domain-containing protein n=1 Tax=Massilia endophytica TaxID=2899220 RepID=UPI001E5A6EE8|nr:secretin and TonB N-terminal domain-containing protein [Massilia endophytica]UGQ48749.1 general secretion pathway protein GspD [Massilia endophytica]
MLVMLSKRAIAVLVALVLAGCAAQTHHRAGMAAAEKGNYPVAVKELAQAAQLAPGDVAYRRDWLRVRENATNRLLSDAASAQANGERAKAAKAYEAVLAYDPENSRALAGQHKLAEWERADGEVEAAGVALKEGALGKAAQLLATAQKRVPAHPEAIALLRELELKQTPVPVTSPSLSSSYRKPINLEFRDASIKAIFDALSRTTGINFIFDKDVRPDQRTTVFLKQTSLDDAIDVILSTSQLEKKVLNASSVLIYPSTSAKLREYQDLVVRAFYLANVEAKQAANMLKTVLKLKDIYVDDKYNLMVLRESPETIALAEKLVKLQDLEEPEIMLEVEVLEINRSRLLNAGVQWNSQFTVTPLGATTSIPTNGSTTSAMKLSDLRNLDSKSIGVSVPSATINLQKTDGDANLLANPRIRVRDREKAKIMIGDKVPVVTTTTTNTFVTENIQYLDVGLKLEVEPDIHLRDEIGLKLGMEVSSLVSSVKTNNGSSAYQIGTRNFNTALRLKDGETQVLAGLISDEDRSSGNKVPLLGEFPILGRLFGSQTDSRTKTEIVLSITPHLIRNIQRSSPADEAFWSGTEAVLRDRPLQLRTAAQGGTADPAQPAAAATRSAQVTPASTPDAPKLAWTGPASVKAGQTFSLELRMDSAEPLRAASLQVACNPAEFELVSLDDGGYFNKDGKGAFSKSFDGASGRASVGMKSGDGAEAGGQGTVLTLTLRAKTPPAAPHATTVGVIAATPIGSKKAVGIPSLPALHNIVITPP